MCSATSVKGWNLVFSDNVLGFLFKEMSPTGMWILSISNAVVVQEVV